MATDFTTRGKGRRNREKISMTGPSSPTLLLDEPSRFKLPEIGSNLVSPSNQSLLSVPPSKTGAVALVPLKVSFGIGGT